MSASELESTAIQAGVRTYGGGGYVLRLTGYIQDLKDRITLLQEENWVDNRTRALIVEFSVYNAQARKMNLISGSRTKSLSPVQEVMGSSLSVWVVSCPISYSTNYA